MRAEPEPAPTDARQPETKQEPKRETRSTFDDAKIIALILMASRAGYHRTGRPCACPDDTMRNGRNCGATSAPHRPGGARPLCYPRDVTPDMIAAFKRTGSAVVAGR